MRLWAALLGALGAVSAAMINSDGLGASAPVPPNPLDWEVNITAYGPADGNTVSQWPTGFTKGQKAFLGAAFDGTAVWFVPHDADRLLSVRVTDGAMRAYGPADGNTVSQWPTGFTKGNFAFYGAEIGRAHV